MQYWYKTCVLQVVSIDTHRLHSSDSSVILCIQS